MKNPFKFRNRADERISYFSKELLNEGKIKFSGIFRVDGTFVGEIIAQAQADGQNAVTNGLLIVGKSGVVRGKIHVQRLLVEGEISGDIVVREKAEILSSAVFRGFLVTPTIRVEEGAKIEGAINDVTKGIDPESGYTLPAVNYGDPHFKGDLDESKTSEAVV